MTVEVDVADSSYKSRRFEPGAELPEGWRWASVDDLLLTAQYGTSAKTGLDSTGVPVLRMGNIRDGALVLESLKYLPGDHREFPALFLQDGDLLFNRTNSPELVGKCTVYRGNPSPCSFASYLIRLRLKPEVVPEYLAWYINSPFGRTWIASVVSQQVGQANVNGTKLKRLRIPLPPRSEQQRIVAEIEKQFTRLDAATAALKRMLSNSGRYRASVLHSACSPNTGWSEMTVESSVQIIDYRGRTPPFSDSGIPHLRSSNVRGGRIVWEGMTFVTELSYDAFMTRGLPQNGDLLFTTEAPMGEVAPAPNEKFSIAQRMMILRTKSEALDPRFLMIQLMSPEFQAKLRYRGTGSTVTGVSSRNLRQLTLRLPPLEEQHRIVAEVERRLSVVDELERVVEANLQRARSLRQSILHRAFSGNL
jgi:type I restriction enzyme S subunit